MARHDGAGASATNLYTVTQRTGAFVMSSASQPHSATVGLAHSTSDLPRVLIVEDETALVTLLRYNLEREGYRVREAHDGEEALLVAAEDTPDVVLLDWMLPQLSGIEVCRRVKSRPETRGIPIIMLSARSEEVDRVRGLGGRGGRLSAEADRLRRWKGGKE